MPAVRPLLIEIAKIRGASGPK